MKTSRHALFVCASLALASCQQKAPDAAASGLDAAAPESAGFNLDSLKTLIASQGIQTVDALFSALPPVYRTYYTMMFRTASQQTATPDAPRMILFGPDGKLLLASAATGDAEVIGYDDKTATFGFFRLQEHQGSALTLTPAKDADECGRCHGGADPRPNWLGYADWPGALGSQDDSAPKGSVEAQSAESIVSSGPGRARYKDLVDLARRYSVSREIPSVSQITPGATVENYRSPLNRSLIVLLSQLNAKRIARMVAAQPAYQQAKYLVASILSDCDAPADIAAQRPDVAAALDRSRGDTMYDRLVAANTKFALGLTIGAPEVWSTSYRLAKTDADAASNGQNFYFPRNPFDADLRGATGIMDESTTLFLVPAELGAYDSDMAGLGDYLCDTGFMAPPNIGAPDAPAIYGKFYCSASDLAAKRAGSSGDGHQATCQTIAQRWSAKGVALPAAGTGQPAVNGPVTSPFPPVAPQLPSQPAKPAQPSQGSVQNQSLEARCKQTGATFKDGQCAFSDGTIVKFPN